MDRDNYFERLATIVDEHGVVVQSVGSGDDGPAFAYTIGLFMVDHPEFIVYGLPSSLAGEILNDLSYAVLRSGMRFAPADKVHRVFEGSFAWLVGLQEPCSHVPVACAFRDRRGFALTTPEVAALQVVWADRDDRWPWDAASAIADIPVLGDRPEGGHNVYLPDPATRRADGW